MPGGSRAGVGPFGKLLHRSRKSRRQPVGGAWSRTRRIATPRPPERVAGGRAAGRRHPADDCSRRRRRHKLHPRLHRGPAGELRLLQPPRSVTMPNPAAALQSALFPHEKGAVPKQRRESLVHHHVAEHPPPQLPALRGRMFRLGAAIELRLGGPQLHSLQLRPMGHDDRRDRQGLSGHTGRGAAADQLLYFSRNTPARNSSRSTGMVESEFRPAAHMCNKATASSSRT